ncbi:hypothetical protein ACLOJK_027322 [Asimina triloba]
MITTAERYAIVWIYDLGVDTGGPYLLLTRLQRVDGDPVDVMLLRMERSPPEIDLGFFQRADCRWKFSDDVSVDDGPPSLVCCPISNLSIAAV